MTVARAALDGQPTVVFHWVLSASAHVRQAIAPPGVLTISLFKVAEGKTQSILCGQVQAPLTFLYNTSYVLCIGIL